MGQSRILMELHMRTVKEGNYIWEQSRIIKEVHMGAVKDCKGTAYGGRSRIIRICIWGSQKL